MLYCILHINLSPILISNVSLATHTTNTSTNNSKRRQEYKYTIEQSTEYTSLMIRQHVGGGKSYYDPKTEVDVWENYTTNDTTEMDDIVIAILDKKKKTPVIVTIECELGDEVNPNLYYLYLAFPATSSSSTEGDADDVSTPPSPQMYRRVRVPLVLFCEKLANAFEKQMTSTALCFVADASSSLGSDMLTNVVKACDHGVVSFTDVVLCSIVVILDMSATDISTHIICTPHYTHIRQQSPTLLG